VTDEARAAFQLQESVDRGARRLLEEEGRLAVAVELHPSIPGAAALRGYCVILDPKHEPAIITIR
jgi:hypothetical protein